MAGSDTTTLSVAAREAAGSRSARRARRDGRVLGVVYGGEGEAVAFDADSREVRHALAAGGAVIELSVDGATGQPVVVKDEQRDPVRGDLLHLDFLRVDLNVAIEATTILDLHGADEAPGVKDGGVLDQITREVNIEALPNEIPETIEHDVSGMEMNDTIFLSAIQAPPGVRILDDLEETVVATLSPPRAEEEPEEIEAETELVGEDGEPIEGETGEAPQAQGEDSGGGDDAGSGDSGGDE
jgi:large subunit ribosomal protein L25